MRPYWLTPPTPSLGQPLPSGALPQGDAPRAPPSCSAALQAHGLTPALPHPPILVHSRPHTQQPLQVHSHPTTTHTHKHSNTPSCMHILISHAHTHILSHSLSHAVSHSLQTHTYSQACSHTGTHACTQTHACTHTLTPHFVTDSPQAPTHSRSHTLEHCRGLNWAPRPPPSTPESVFIQDISM